MEEAKSLTNAQKTHLLKLVAQRDAAQANLDAFVDYLSAEHETSRSDGWALNLTSGFVRTVQESHDGV